MIPKYILDEMDTEIMVYRISDEKLAAMVKQTEKPTGLWARFWKWVAA